MYIHIHVLSYHTYTCAGVVTAVVSLGNLGQCLRVLCWATDVDLIVVHLDLKARGKKCVEPYN